MPYFQLRNTSPVRSRTEKADAMTFVSQLDPQTSSWFNRSSLEVQQCRTPSTTTAFRLRFQSQQCRTPSTPESNSTMALSVSKFNSVELHRQAHTVSICIFVACQQCRIPSTNCMSSPVLSNSISTCPRWHARQQCRTPSTHRNGASAQQCRTPSTIQRCPVRSRY